MANEQAKTAKEVWRGPCFAPRSMTIQKFFVVVVSGVSLLSTLGCAASPPCRRGPKDDVTVAGRTTGEAIKTAGETGVEGVKTAGKAVGGLVTDGTKGAKKEWEEGKAETKATADNDSAKVKEEANVPPCKD